MEADPRKKNKTGGNTAFKFDIQLIISWLYIGK